MQALPNFTCPLCGGPNSCAAAATGSLATPCWCTDAAIDPSVLATVPEADRNRSCICAACAKAIPLPELPIGKRDTL